MICVNCHLPIKRISGYAWTHPVNANNWSYCANALAGGVSIITEPNADFATPFISLDPDKLVAVRRELVAFYAELS